MLITEHLIVLCDISQASAKMWVLSCLRLSILISTSSAFDDRASLLGVDAPSIRGCVNTKYPPEVSVADSDHLLINWAKSFEGCESKVFKTASVQTRSGVYERVKFAANEARIRANPCLKHLDIKIKAIVDEKDEVEVWSHGAVYNDYAVYPKIVELYSGLLRKPIFDKICDENANVIPLSDVPEEIKQCMKGSIAIKRGGNDVFFKFTIVDPSRPSGVKEIKEVYKTSEHCTLNDEVNNENSESPQGSCRTDRDLKIEVSSATNLVVDWEDSFKDCETHQIAATKVLVDNKPTRQYSGAVRAMVDADPCLRHKIEVTLEMKQGNICSGQRITQTSTSQGCKLSQFFYYNFYNNEGWNIKELYSGLLQGKFVRQLCANSNNSALQIPEVPEKINKCVFSDDTKRKGQNRFTVPILNPSNGLGRAIIEVNCKDMGIHNDNSENGTKVDAGQNQALIILPLIIGSVFLALVVIAIVVVTYLLYSKKKSRDKGGVMKEDTNMYYDTAGVDYVYSTAGQDNDYDTMGKEASTRREVKKIIRVEMVGFHNHHYESFMITLLFR